MKIKSLQQTVMEFDMTPMIDMTFQLIAFFMVLINFDASDQDERCQLPSSTLAKPPNVKMETPIVLQILKDGSCVVGGQSYADIALIKPVLQNEASILQLKNKSASDANIIIRAHRLSKTGQVQDLIRLCQELQFEKFTLRAKEDRGGY